MKWMSTVLYLPNSNVRMFHDEYGGACWVLPLFIFFSLFCLVVHLVVQKFDAYLDFFLCFLRFDFWLIISLVVWFLKWDACSHVPGVLREI